jgi:galactokinase
MASLFVPGRLCLFGEHTDWAGAFRTSDPHLSAGYCLVTGTDQGLAADVEPLDDAFEISSVLPGGRFEGPVSIPAAAGPLEHTARGGGFFSYAAGVAAEISARHRVGGLRLRITASDLPLRKGLASSAAVSVLVARAYSNIYGLGYSWRDEMELAYAGERRAGSACGRMDQICALGPATTLLTFDGPAMHIEPVRHGARFWLLVVDLNRAKDTRRILADLNRCFPDTPGSLAAGVREALGPRNAALVAAARAAIEAGDAPALGALMCEAQQLFDALVSPASPELVAPHLHDVLAHPAVQALAWGAKGVGSQGDGCAQILARGEHAREILADTLARDLGTTHLFLTLEPSAGAPGNASG